MWYEPKEGRDRRKGVKVGSKTLVKKLITKRVMRSKVTDKVSWVGLRISKGPFYVPVDSVEW